MVLLLDWKKMYITFNIFSEYKYTEDPRIEWTFVYKIWVLFETTLLFELLFYVLISL